MSRREYTTGVPAWLRELLPSPRYSLEECTRHGNDLELHLTAGLGSVRFPFEIRLRAVDSRVGVAIRDAQLPGSRAREALARDIQRRVGRCPVSNLFDYLDAVDAQARHDSDEPPWRQLKQLEAGQIAEATRAIQSLPDESSSVAATALHLLLAIAAGDRERRSYLWWSLATNHRADGRMLEALAAIGEDVDDAFRRAAAAVLRWGVSGRSTPSCYGFPDSPLPSPRAALAPFADILPARVDEFERNGFIVLRGVLDRCTVDGWLQSVVASFRSAVESDPAVASSSLARSLVAGGDATDATGEVRWSTGMVPVHLVSTELAATVDALVGGDEGFKPLFSDHLHISRVNRPSQPNDDGFHLDETPADGRVDNQYLNLLGLVLLTDVDEKDGPTIFLPESPPLIARALQQGDGIDQDDRVWTREIAGRCSKRVPATGRAGDVYLAHPLTLHRRGAVERACFRVISNPNFMHSEPLRYLDPQSPVERYAARGLAAAS